VAEKPNGLEMKVTKTKYCIYLSKPNEENFKALYTNCLFSKN
jgi:hypothetical protein